MKPRKTSYAGLPYDGPALPVSTTPSRRKSPVSTRLFQLILVAATLGFVYLQLLPTLRNGKRLVLTPAPTKPLVFDPADEWKDDIWPIRPPTPWDISTDFPFPRTLEYDVQEGTWLRLDVHPKSGDIVFDMAGDIYCLPAKAYMGSLSAATKAHPILLGVPHDSDPHFSPEGDRIVFRSDAELGVENIWIKEWKGCEEMDLRPLTPRGELQQGLKFRTHDDELLAGGIKETAQRKRRRLVREGRFGGT